MKNVIIGILGGICVIYVVLIALSVYCVSSRKNQMELCVSSVMRSVMEEYCGRKTAAGQVEQVLQEELSDRLSGDGSLSTIIYACDMEKGVISLEVTEEFPMPSGIDRTISTHKTIIWDRSGE